MSRLIGRASDTVGAPTVPQRPALKYIESGCVITNRGSTTTAPTHTHMGGRGYSTVLVQEFVLYGNFFSSRTAAGSPKSRNNHPPRLPLHPFKSFFYKEETTAWRLVDVLDLDRRNTANRGFEFQLYKKNRVSKPGGAILYCNTSGLSIRGYYLSPYRKTSIAGLSCRVP